MQFCNYLSKTLCYSINRCIKYGFACWTFCIQIKVFANTPVYFTDVNEKAWYYKGVMELAKRGLVSGYYDKTFKPNAQIRVDEYIKLMVSAVDGNDKLSQSGNWADKLYCSGKRTGYC